MIDMGDKKGSGKYPGVYVVEGKKGISYGIDYPHPITGERIQKIIKGCKSEYEAHKIRSIEVSDAMRGVLVAKYDLPKQTRAISFERAVELYDAWAEDNRKSYRVEHFKYGILKRYFHGRLMSDINPFLIERYKSDRLNKDKVGKHTINQELSMGKAIFRKAIEWEKYTGENPFDKVPSYKIPKRKKPGYLEVEDIEKIRDAITHPVKRDMVEFALATGWRISEITGLRWENVDLEDEGVAYLVDTKNNDAPRKVLGDAAAEVIRRQKKRGEYVFCKINGQKYKTCLNAIIGNAAKRSGVDIPDGKKWHIFRRSWTTFMLRAGCDVVTLQETGNWKDITMPLWYADGHKDAGKRMFLNQVPRLNSTGEKREKFLNEKAAP